MSLPLAGIRVIDLTQLLPGPLATRHLQEWGAEVIKVEPPGVGDGARLLYRGPAQAAADEPSGFFRDLNRHKASWRLDLRQTADRDRLLEQLRSADVLIEGFRPGVMQRLGLDWPVLQALNPRLVMASITGDGQCGPYALRAGH
ncbi:MAG: CoA transferase, partial [Betaproteobacteria bacterium]